MEPVLAVHDACVLYPAPLRDLLLHLAGVGLVRPRWTDAIHVGRLRSSSRGTCNDHGQVLAAEVISGTTRK